MESSLTFMFCKKLLHFSKQETANILSTLQSLAINLFCFSTLIIFCACSSDDATSITSENTPPIENPEGEEGEVVYNQNVTNPNILLIIADDMGMDSTPYATQFSSTKPTMPNLDKLIQNGVRFQNAWAYPSCTPTRGTIITGKQAPTTGLLAPGDHIDSSETSLQGYINNTYSTAVIGKWHLSNNAVSPDPESLDIDFYKGNTGGGLNDYYNWELYEDGVTEDITNYYGTTAYTDYAIDWINDQTTPWFCWIAYNAAHTTFHTPTDPDLYTHVGSDDLDMYLQMLEAMDAEIGRLLENIPSNELANTLVVFVGDNGTPGQVAQTPFSRSTSKGSLHSGGVNVPFIVAGANVTRTNESEEALIQTTDLFSTIADLSGVSSPNTNESISFKELLTQSTTTSSRQFSYAQGEASGSKFGGYTVRNSTYKLNYDEDADVYYLYNVLTDYTENDNLYDGDLTIDEQAAFNELVAEYNRIQAL